MKNPPGFSPGGVALPKKFRLFTLHFCKQFTTVTPHAGVGGEPRDWAGIAVGLWETLSIRPAVLARQWLAGPVGGGVKTSFGQYSTYSWPDPADKSMGTTITSPPES